MPDPLAEPLAAIKRAILNEIAVAKTDPSQSFDVTDGKLARTHSGSYFYIFRVKHPIPLPPETRVHVACPELDRVEGEVVEALEFELVLSLNQDIGVDVPEATVYSQPWFIYEELHAHIVDLEQEEGWNSDLPQRLLRLENGRTDTESECAGGCASGSSNARGFTSGTGNELQHSRVKLNPVQSHAVENCLNSSLHFVWGPPGTGKTRTLGACVAELATRGERVLVLCHANRAVDTAMLSIADALSGSPLIATHKVLRVGAPYMEELQARTDLLPVGVIEQLYPDLAAEKGALERRKRRLSQALRRALATSEPETVAGELQSVHEALRKVSDRIDELLSELIKDACVLCATVSRLAIQDLLWQWGPDAVVVDEASMLSAAYMVPVATRARKRFLLYGDFRQLSPICLTGRESARAWLAVSAFETAGVVASADNNCPDPRMTMLTEQYRMAPDIASLVSAMAYGGKLRTAPETLSRRRPATGILPLPGASLVLVDTTELGSACMKEARPSSHSRFNPIHAALALSIATQQGIALDLSMGIITPYRAQAELLYSALHGAREGLAAATVHRFQGSERDVIVLDAVDAPPQTRPSQLTGENIDETERLLNVALSRARDKLIIICDRAFLARHSASASPLRQLVEDWDRYGSWGDALAVTAHMLSDTVQWADGFRSRSPALMLGDIAMATRDIYVSAAPDSPLPQELLAALDERAKSGVSVRLFCGFAAARDLEGSSIRVHLKPLAGSPFCTIDSKIAWIAGNGSQDVAARVSAPQFCDTFEQYMLGKHLWVAGPLDASVMQELCGPCPDCGEARAPHQAGNGLWVIRCDDPTHEGTLLSQAHAVKLVKSMDVRCRLCGSPVDVLSEGEGVRLACPRARRGCSGRVPSLFQLFGAG